MDDQRPRLLILGGRFVPAELAMQKLDELYDVDVVERVDQAMAALRQESYHAVLADVGDFLPLERGLVGQQSSLVLNTIGEGVCIVDTDGRCTWTNSRMRAFPEEVLEKVKQICSQAMMIFTRHLVDESGQERPRSKKFTFQADGERYFEMMTSPVVDETTQVRQVVAVVWDATSGKRLQQKIDAIDASGHELARLESDAISKLSPGQRLQVLRDKIIKYSKDLMHFDHFVIRVLDAKTNKLELVIAEGLPPEATEIDLYAQPEGNGISGYVAATGRSYICHDTEKDPRYVIGLQHCKSSLTVPLLLHDKVIGVYNIESETVGAFNEDDRQFAEIFGRYVAFALHTLDLLVRERCTTSGQLAENVVQEMAHPLNDIITDTQSLMEDYIGDEQMHRRLAKIVSDVQNLRDTVRDVMAGPKTILGSMDVEVSGREGVLAGKRVLIADDEANIRRTIGDILSKHGCICTLCKDGFEAVTQLERSSFDLVVSDIKMPYRNGYEIFAIARRRDEKLPVILMTGFGYDPNHSIVRASQEGLSAVLFKPFKVEQLMEEIYKALDITMPAPAAAEGKG